MISDRLSTPIDAHHAAQHAGLAGRAAGATSARSSLIVPVPLLLAAAASVGAAAVRCSAIARPSTCSSVVPGPGSSPVIRPFCMT